jgi:hypothetical protein
MVMYIVLPVTVVDSARDLMSCPETVPQNGQRRVLTGRTLEGRDGCPQGNFGVGRSPGGARHSPAGACGSDANGQRPVGDRY